MTVLRIFGRTRLDVDGATIAPWSGVKQRQLVELLALHHPAPMSKDRLADLLWDGRPPSSAMRTLESHVCVVRRELRAAGLPRDLVVTETDGYRLSERVAVDLDTVRRLLAPAGPRSTSGRTRTSTPPFVTAALRALVVSHEPLLASSPYAPWARAAAAAVGDEIAEACIRASGLALRASRYADASLLADRALQQVPLSETACRAAVRAHAAQGDRCRALVTFADFRERVRDELGVEPSRATTTAYLEALSDAGADGVSRSELAVLRRLLAQTEPAGPRTTVLRQVRPATSRTRTGVGVGRGVGPGLRASVVP